jgi:molybdopterin/thiamine biosynthesis adenylyltransferase
MDNLDRYARQVVLSEIGDEGQRRLLASTVAVVGCGALGTNIANALVRAGVGYVRIIDRDFVELNNLQRQVLFDEDDIAQALPKAIAAADKLRRINSQVQIEPVVADVNPDNIEQLLGDVDGLSRWAYNCQGLHRSGPGPDVVRQVRRLVTSASCG